MSATVKARWAGGFPVHYAPEDRVLQPGDIAEVPAAEARDSENWQPVKKGAETAKGDA